MELKACFPHWVPVFTILFSLRLASRTLPWTDEHIITITIIITIIKNNSSSGFTLHQADGDGNGDNGSDEDEEETGS